MAGMWLRGWKLPPRGLNYALFVPPQLASIRSALHRGEPSQMIAEASRLAALGSGDAKALLGYLELRAAVTGQSRYDRAEVLSQEAFRQGNAFGEYVLGWVRFEQGRPVDALAHLVASGKQMFLPAIVDVGRFMVSGIGVKEADPIAAEKMFLLAHRLGHRVALPYILRIYRRGKRGVWRRLLGFVALPFALARLGAYTWLQPFSEKAFVHAKDARRPLFNVSACQ
ncbi:MAG TPA: hypothetical protein VE907_10440 [Gammaproteobacteria bacterium]|nr:hypothetical protein [Gammaproteobacteria bacterium]